MASLLEIEAPTFSEAFARRSIAVNHRLVDHPLFSLDAIAALADRLPPASVRRERPHRPDLPGCLLYTSDAADD